MKITKREELVQRVILEHSPSFNGMESDITLRSTGNICHGGCRKTIFIFRHWKNENENGFDAMQSLSYKQHNLGEIKYARRLERNCGNQFYPRRV